MDEILKLGLVKILTSRSYFGKMNSILGSVVPLATFLDSHFLIIIAKKVHLKTLRNATFWGGNIFVRISHERMYSPLHGVTKALAYALDIFFYVMRKNIFAEKRYFCKNLS